MEESESGAIFYDKVYEAARPELFFKATPHRVVGHGAAVRIRADAKWNVPEPELTLVLNSRMQLVGFTAGNDMSSRDIEGENPLYLPQAKVYNGCCALGPVITLAAAMPPAKEIGISLAVKRAGQSVFSGQTSIEQMARTFEDLIPGSRATTAFPTACFCSPAPALCRGTISRWLLAMWWKSKSTASARCEIPWFRGEKVSRSLICMHIQRMLSRRANGPRRRYNKP